MAQNRMQLRLGVLTNVAFKEVDKYRKKKKKEKKEKKCYIELYMQVRVNGIIKKIR
jgi:hypothetical protein